MLHDMSWLAPGQIFPPSGEKTRMERYAQNKSLFDSGHFGDKQVHESYLKVARRIKRVIGNFEDVISFPVLLNYQWLMSIKMADLVCGEQPTITGSQESENAELKLVRDRTDFDEKLYAAVIDMSRYGDAVQRVYLDDQKQRTFTNWDPAEWFPIVSQDGTCTITHHCLCWRVNKGKDAFNPDWYMHVQIHGTAKEDIGKYIYKVFRMDQMGMILRSKVSETVVQTGLDVCAVQHLRSYSVTGTVFGHDDYTIIDSILAEILTRIGQISVILDKHADPNITGPASMLSLNPDTGEYQLKTGKFYAVSPGEEQPQYMVWEGHLDAAFKQLELLINQLYILSEMGAALLGSQEGGSQAISGTAMRFKMVNPLAKARRIANALTKPVRRLFAALTSDAVAFENISVFWSDGLPDDPRENIENAKLASGQSIMMPMEKAIVEFFGRSSAEALEWIEAIQKQKLLEQKLFGKQVAEDDPNRPGPNRDDGVNNQSKGSKTGLTSFQGPNTHNT